MTHLLAKFIKRFLSHYLPLQKGLAANTILAYRDSIKLLICYAADRLEKSAEDLLVEQIDQYLVLDYLDYLEKNRGCTTRTRNARLAAIRALFGFVAREEPSLLLHCHSIRTIPLKRAQHKTVGYLEEDEMQAMLDSVEMASRTGVRDSALILLLYNTGARVSEIVNLRETELRLNSNGQINILGKGNKFRSCPLWPETVDALKVYLEHRIPKDPATQQLFLNANGAPITRFGIRHIIGKYATVARENCLSLENKTISTHTIRHTTAMHLLRAGNDINMVGYWLGHVDTNTTHIYVEIDMEMKRKMLTKTKAPAIKKILPWQEPGILQWLKNVTRSPKLCAVNY
jgi:integrase/recombinase XerD